MEITKLKFMTKRTQVKYLGAATNPATDDLTECDVKNPAIPHPDLAKACSALIPHLQVVGDLKNGNYQILEIKFSTNDESESITVTMQKNLEGGKVAKIHLPAMEVKDNIVDIVSDIIEEIEAYVMNRKQAQGQLNFDGEADQETEEEPSQAEAA